MSIKILEKFEIDLYRVIAAANAFHIGYKFIAADMSYVEIIAFGLFLIIFAKYTKMF